ADRSGSSRHRRPHGARGRRVVALRLRGRRRQLGARGVLRATGAIGAAAPRDHPAEVRRAARVVRGHRAGRGVRGDRGPGPRGVRSGLRRGHRRSQPPARRDRLRLHPVEAVRRDTEGSGPGSGPLSEVAELTEDPFTRGGDLRPLLAMVAGARASRHPHAFLYPGGLQWLLRRLANESFTVRLWRDGAAPAAAIVDDAGNVMLVSADPSLERYLWLLDRAEAGRRERSDGAIEISVWDGDHELLSAIASRGYAPSGSLGYELANDRVSTSVTPRLPDGFRMGWLEPALDDAYIELHRAAWSTRAASPYRRALHDAVTAMPDFDRRLVAVATAS